MAVGLYDILLQAVGEDGCILYVQPSAVNAACSADSVVLYSIKHVDKYETHRRSAESAAKAVHPTEALIAMIFSIVFVPESLSSMLVWPWYCSG